MAVGQSGKSTSIQGSSGIEPRLFTFLHLIDAISGGKSKAEADADPDDRRKNGSNEDARQGSGAVEV